MAVYAIIDSETNLCDNMIVWDDATPWTPPPDHYAVANDDGRGDIGWTYNPVSEEWTPPPPPPPLPSPTVSASYQPSTISAGSPVTLSWSTTNATYVTIQSRGLTKYPANGSLKITYGFPGVYDDEITAYGSGEPASEPLSIMVT